jgi:nucleoside-diphosphate-sugar epimerase
MPDGAVLGDPKNAQLKQLDGAVDRLRLFKDDVLDRAALAAAVEGCEGVFHVASPVPTDKIVDPEVSIGRFTWYPN